MVNIKNVVILITPFHKKAMEHIFPKILNLSSTLILHSNYLSLEGLNCNKKELKNYNFSRIEIFSNPIKSFKKQRKKLRV